MTNSMLPYTILLDKLKSLYESYINGASKVTNQSAGMQAVEDALTAIELFTLCEELEAAILSKDANKLNSVRLSVTTFVMQKQSKLGQYGQYTQYGTYTAQAVTPSISGFIQG